MSTLYTIACPELDAADREFIEVFRAEHDPRSSVVAAHFTLVHACDQVPEACYIAHVAAVAARTRRIDFCCRYAMLGADDEDDGGLVYLVPDEGHASLSLLHDDLYGGPLAPHLRLDLPFTPHITIGRGSRRQAKALCDRLNVQGVHIGGAVHSLQVGAVQGGAFVTTGRHRLGTPA